MVDTHFLNRASNFFIYILMDLIWVEAELEDRPRTHHHVHFLHVILEQHVLCASAVNEGSEQRRRLRPRTIVMGKQSQARRGILSEEAMSQTCPGDGGYMFCCDQGDVVAMRLRLGLGACVMNALLWARRLGAMGLCDRSDVVGKEHGACGWSQGPGLV